MARRTIADVAAQVLIETDNDGVMFGDMGLLDLIAKRADEELGTRLCLAGPWEHRNNRKFRHPLNVHALVLGALETKRGKELFEKFHDRYTGVRIFRLRERVEA